MTAWKSILEFCQRSAETFYDVQVRRNPRYCISSLFASRADGLWCLRSHLLQVSNSSYDSLSTFSNCHVDLKEQLFTVQVDFLHIFLCSSLIEWIKAVFLFNSRSQEIRWKSKRVVFCEYNLQSEHVIQDLLDSFSKMRVIYPRKR